MSALKCYGDGIYKIGELNMTGIDKIGVIAPLTDDPTQAFLHVREVGLKCCQLVSWEPTKISQATAENARQIASDMGIIITHFWCGYSGPVVWNYTEGPATIGLVPPEFRELRTRELMRGAEIASWLGTSDVITHVGFLPIDPKDENYRGAVEALKVITGKCAELNIYFDFETGQETPMVLRRCIEDVGTGNLGVNLDPANLLLYGMANPVDAVDLIGAFVRGVHGKDGEYPTSSYELGCETAMGEGKVNFPALIPKLRKAGYQGGVTIEREISGPKQIEDIQRAIDILAPLL
jgi:sugar phosphate isomerase/epimerase